MVATKAFGMGINNENVRHVIRNGVPPNINTWVQELGRARRNGQAATATILYSESDVQNVLGWLRDHLRNRVVRDTILSEYDASWKLVYCKLAGKCIRKMLLEYYDEELQVAVECVMDLKGSSFLVPKKQGVWYKLYKPWDLRENVKFQNFSGDPTVHG